LRLQVVKEDDNQEFICCDDKSGYEYQGEWGAPMSLFPVETVLLLIQVPLVGAYLYHHPYCPAGLHFFCMGTELCVSMF
jgi:hypothetical protein